MGFFDFCKDAVEVVLGYVLKRYRARLDHRLRRWLAVAIAAVISGVVGFVVGASDLPWWILPFVASMAAATAGVVYVSNPIRCVARVEARRDRVLLDWVASEIAWIRENVSDVVWTDAYEPLETVRVHLQCLVERRHTIEVCQHKLAARPFKPHTLLGERSDKISKQLATIVPGIIRLAQDREDAIKADGEQVETAIEAYCILLERAEVFLLRSDDEACDLPGFKNSLDEIARTAAPLLGPDQPDVEGNANVTRLRFPGKHS